MLADYWWVFILMIFVLMVITPNKVEKMKNTKKYKNKELKLNPNYILKNINKITGYYVGVS